MARDDRTVILMMGLPKSGKSTWAGSTGLPVVELDAVRKAVHGQVYIAAAEPIVLAHALVMVRTLLYSGHPTVIVDGTNVGRAKRDRWRDWLDGIATVRIQLMTASVAVCKRRARLSGQERLEGVIEFMDAHWEPLGADELRVDESPGGDTLS